VRGIFWEKGIMYEEDGSSLTTGGNAVMKNRRVDKRGAIGGDDGEGARWQKKPVIPDRGYRESKPTPVMPDIVNRASIVIGFGWIPGGGEESGQYALPGFSAVNS
jgi:hypothetical protein